MVTQNRYVTPDKHDAGQGNRVRFSPLPAEDIASLWRQVAIQGIKAGALLVMGALLLHSDCLGNVDTYPYDELARDTGLSVDSVRHYVGRLHKVGQIDVTERGNAHKRPRWRIAKVWRP